MSPIVRSLKVERIPDAARADVDLALDGNEEFWIAEDRHAGEVVATVYKTSRGTEEATAQLFGAAPDMLQALREVVGGAFEPGVCVWCGISEGDAHDADCTMNFVLDALAKAEARA